MFREIAQKHAVERREGLWVKCLEKIVRKI